MPSPTRTCVGCRQTAAKRQLLRVVWTAGGLRPDLRQVEPGRGAYLHRAERCVELALKRKAFPRALRLTGAGVDPATARAALIGHLEPAD